MKMSRISLATRIATVIAVSLVATTAFYVRSGEPGITFAPGNFNLKIDSEATYNGNFYPSGTWALKNLVPGVDKFWNFDDIKPGDYGENTISFHADTKTWICLDFINLGGAENGINEPEGELDLTLQSGELVNAMEFFSWRDDGDNIFELGEKPIFGTTTQSASVVLASTTYAVADAAAGPCSAYQTCYIGVEWCAGNLEVNLATAEITCDPTTLGNVAQTDTMTVDVRARAFPAKDNPGFLCNGKKKVNGCTPGYWKQKQHFDEWTAPYTPNTLFGSVFDNAFPGKTLKQVAGLGGGGLNALGRHTVAALLNAANPDVNYAYTVAEVISMFNAVYPGSNAKYEELKNIFEKNNQLFCPLN